MEPRRRRKTPKTCPTIRPFRIALPQGHSRLRQPPGWVCSRLIWFACRLDGFARLSAAVRFGGDRSWPERLSPLCRDRVGLVGKNHLVFLLAITLAVGDDRLAAGRSRGIAGTIVPCSGRFFAWLQPLLGSEGADSCGGSRFPSWPDLSRDLPLRCRSVWQAADAAGGFLRSHRSARRSDNRCGRCDLRRARLPRTDDLSGIAAPLDSRLAQSPRDPPTSPNPSPRPPWRSPWRPSATVVYLMLPAIRPAMLALSADEVEKAPPEKSLPPAAETTPNPSILV